MYSTLSSALLLHICPSCMYSLHVHVCTCIFRWSKDTPLPTPTHRYNAWADDRKSLGITPRPKGGVADEEGAGFKSEQDKELWEEEQKVAIDSTVMVVHLPQGNFHMTC